MDSILRSRNKKDEIDDAFVIPTMNDIKDEFKIKKNNDEYIELLVKINGCLGFIFALLHLKGKTFYDYLKGKYNYYLSRSKESNSKHSRLVENILWFIVEYGYNISYICILIFFTYIFVSYIPKIRKYVYGNTYIDNLNRTIEDPFLFTNDNDTKWSVVYNHYDDNFVKWLAMKQKYEVRKITEKEVENGYLQTEIFGIEGTHNVSFAIIEEQMNKLSNLLGDCINAKNLGLPLNIIFIKTTKKYFLIEPRIIFQSPIVKKFEFSVPSLDTTNQIVWSQMIIEPPSEVRVGFLPYFYNDPEQDRELRFGEYESACIHFLSPRYIV